MMKLTTALGVALASLTVAAYAQSEHSRVVVRHAGGAMMNMDADGDGWMTRAEAGAAAERMFAELDSNQDGRIDGEDRGPGEFELRVETHEGTELEGDNCTTTVEPANAPEGADRRVTVICLSEGESGERRTERRVTVERSGDGARAERREERRIEREAERAAREAERLAEAAERLAEDAERRVERHMVIVNGDHVWTSEDAPDALAPLPPPHAPMFFMTFGGAGEADLNGDGAMSLEEFRAQRLRFFDAGDANGDGRVRIEGPRLEAPAPAAAPTPPRPPRRN